jgi:hypothetical protein
VIGRSLFLLISLLLVVAVVAGLAYRPGTIAGVHAGDLAQSLEDAGGLSRSRCDQRPDDTWRCEAHTKARGKGAAVTYRVRVHGHFGCWNATRTGGPGRHRLSGCITAFDYF